MNDSIFQNAKVALILWLDVSRDTLHVYAGLAVMLGVAAIFRLSLRDWRPLAAVAVAALAGEAWDLIDDLRFGHKLDFDANWHDVSNTLFWPLILFLLARFTKVLKR